MMDSVDQSKLVQARLSQVVGLHPQGSRDLWRLWVGGVLVKLLPAPLQILKQIKLLLLKQQNWLRSLESQS